MRRSMGLAWSWHSDPDECAMYDVIDSVRSRATCGVPRIRVCVKEIGAMEKERARTWIRDVAAAVAAAARCFPETH